jgi:serine/threonine protein kinase
MNDIYKQKAKKYKYKYLKLKREYFGEGGGYLGEGSFGCIITPPIEFIEPEVIFNKFEKQNLKTNEYIGKIINCNYVQNISTLKIYNSFDDEYEEFKNLDTIDPNVTHRSKLIYAAIINKKELNNDIIKKQIDRETINCIYRVVMQTIYDKKLERIISLPLNQTNSNKYKEKYMNKYFGYIICTKVGKSFDKIQFYQYDETRINYFLIALKNSIDFIKILYEKEYIHADIKFENITYDEQLQKVYFIDFGFLQKYNEKIYEIEKKSYYFIYPRILFFYFKIKKKYGNNTITKTKLVNELNFYYQQYKYDKNSLNIYEIILKNTKQSNIDFMIFFKSIDDNYHSFEYFFDNCIKSIIQNIDIYSLSIIIYELFNNSRNNNLNTKKIINTLLINALYNTIDGPDELVIYLEGIINSFQNINTNRNVIDNIINRRKNNNDKPISRKIIYINDNNNIVILYVQTEEELKQIAIRQQLLQQQQREPPQRAPQQQPQQQRPPQQRPPLTQEELRQIVQQQAALQQQPQRLTQEELSQIYYKQQAALQQQQQAAKQQFVPYMLPPDEALRRQQQAAKQQAAQQQFVPYMQPPYVRPPDKALRREIGIYNSEIRTRPLNR